MKLLKKIVSTMILTIFAVSILALSCNIEKAKAGTITVPDNYPTIQEAINHAAQGDLVYIRNGTYFEHIEIGKAITLVGENRDNTIIDGQGQGFTPIIRINQTGVAVKNLTVRNTSKIEVTFGILVFRTQNVSLIDLNVEETYDGIMTNFSNNTKILDNLITRNYASGITSLSNWSYSLITNNVIAQNAAGVRLERSSCQNNTFYHNNFINNTIQVSSFGTALKWDNGYPSGGNFWSDYDSADTFSGPYQNETGRDGIGDIPHFGYFEDNYPLMHPYGSIRNLDTSLAYLTIQSAINAPETLAGHTVFVRNGTYYEHVTIGKSIALIGESKDATIIEGNKTGTIIRLFAGNITITDFTIQNTSQGNYESGVSFCNYSGNNLLARNKIINCYQGIYLWKSAGSNIIKENTIAENSFGIFSYETINDLILDNDIISNGEGIWLAGYSSNVLVARNSISHNRLHGIRVEANDNVIYHNNIIGNVIQASVPTVPYVSSIWDNGSTGNYWSDYTGSDSNGDGVGDTPYFIDSNNTDRHPLMGPWARIRGDVNDDGAVNILDIVAVASIYGCKEGEPNWNPEADIAPQYGSIDLLDLVTCISHYGEKYH